MKNILFAFIAGLLLTEPVLAQDPAPPAGGSTPQDQQAPMTPGGRPQLPEPSNAQPSAPQQTPESQSAPAPESGQAGATSGAPKIAPGSVIPAQLTKGVDAKKAKTGDEVVAKVTQDMKTTSGEVLVPKDTKLVGHVTEAQPRSKEQKESQVGIAFDRAVMKNGSEMQLPMSIQAIIGQNNPNAAGNDQTSSQPDYPSTGGASGTSGAPARTPGMGSTPQPAPSPSGGGNTMPDSPQTGTNVHGPITAQTQGVVGISNLKLSPAPNATQGSMVSSDKNNVKLDGGTLLLLKVTPYQ